MSAAKEINEQGQKKESLRGATSNPDSTARYSKPQQLQEVVKHQMGVWLSEKPLQVKTDET